MMNKKELIDRYFLDARHKLLDVAAFIDRVERAEGDEDYRLDAIRRAVEKLVEEGGDRAKTLLELFSDPTSEPIERADQQGASGAYRAKGSP